MLLSRIRPYLLPIGLAVIFAIAVSAVGWWKYAHYKYQGLDLAIYTNVLASLAQGHGWWSSIQGGSYLGDHVEPILLLLVPFFRLWPDPRLLIMLQALVLGATVIPVFFLLRGAISPRLRLVVCVLWLLNPLLWNTALFEFHALAFAPVLLLTAIAAYRGTRWIIASLALLLSCAVREDVALLVAMVGMVALLEAWHQRAQISGVRRRAWWGMGALLLGASWFLVATRIGAAHTTAGAYKFLIYYGWLGDSFPAVLMNAVRYPLHLLRHVLSLGNVELVIGLLMPFLFVPLAPLVEWVLRGAARGRPTVQDVHGYHGTARWLLLGVPPLLQIMLGAAGGSSLVIDLHYGLLFLPALIVTTADVLGAWQVGAFPRLRRLFCVYVPLPRSAWIAMGMVAYCYVVIALGPFLGIAEVVFRGAASDVRLRRAAYDALLAQVPSDASLAVGYAALPHVAARPAVYSLGYAALGVNQFAERPYVIPESARYLLLDTRDALAYAIQFPQSGWARPYAALVPDRLRAMVRSGAFGVVAERDGVALLARGISVPSPSDAYFAPPPSIRGHLVVDRLRDIMVERE